MRSFITLCILHVAMGAAPLFATNTYPLVICASLNADHAHLVNGGSFPDALAESNCVAIDVCAEVNSRGQSVSRDTWIHRSHSALWFDGEYELAQDGVYNYHSVQYARIPAGVVLHSCSPDFVHLRVTGEYRCDNATITTSTGTCPPVSFDGSSFDLEECITAVEYDKEGPHRASLYGSTQMIRYSFVQDWGCLEPSDVVASTMLSSSTKPNTLIPCTDIANGYHVNLIDCSFACNEGYDQTATSCEPKCGPTTELSCATGHYASESCTLMPEPRYVCSACDAVAGTRFLPWQSTAPGVCNREDCPTGTHEADGECVACAEHHYSTSGQSSCEACARGTYQPEVGKSVCLDCFADTIDTSALCGEGEMLLRSVSELDAYYANLTEAQQNTYDLLQVCTASYACVPCKPGYFAVSQVCWPCARGTYQPNFKSSVCFDCSTGQNTTHEASISGDECVCDPGFE